MGMGMELGVTSVERSEDRGVCHDVLRCGGKYITTDAALRVTHSRRLLPCARAPAYRGWQRRQPAITAALAAATLAALRPPRGHGGGECGDR